VEVRGIEPRSPRRLTVLHPRTWSLYPQRLGSWLRPRASMPVCLDLRAGKPALSPVLLVDSLFAARTARLETGSQAALRATTAMPLSFATRLARVDRVRASGARRTVHIPWIETSSPPKEERMDNRAAGGTEGPDHPCAGETVLESTFFSQSIVSCSEQELHRW